MDKLYEMNGLVRNAQRLKEHCKKNMCDGCCFCFRSQSGLCCSVGVPVEWENRFIPIDKEVDDGEEEK